MRILWVNLTGEPGTPALCERLGRHCRVRVCAATVVSTAFEGGATPDIICLDCADPDADARAVVQGIKLGYPSIPLLMFTTSHSAELVIWAMRTRVWDCFIKPVSCGEVMRRLNILLPEKGDHEALDVARALLEEQQYLSLADQERLFGYLEGGGRIILPEPQALLTPASKMPGLDGRKMSKSYHNTIALRDDPAEVAERLRRMPTDPARVRRDDPGDPERCPVWQLHQVYSDEGRRQWVQDGCRSAGIGCLDCKQPVIEAVVAELTPIQERAREFEQDPALVRRIISEGCEAARDAADETMDEVRSAIGLNYK